MAYKEAELYQCQNQKRRDKKFEECEGCHNKFECWTLERPGVPWFLDTANRILEKYGKSELNMYYRIIKTKILTRLLDTKEKHRK